MWAYHNLHTTLLPLVCFFTSLCACQEVDPRIQLEQALRDENQVEISKCLAMHSIDFRDDKGNTLLMLFVNGTLPTTVTQRLFMLNRLIELGADINAQNNAKESALMHASKQDSIEVFYELLYLGANIHLQDRHNKTAYARLKEVYLIDEILPCSVIAKLTKMINFLENWKRQKLL